ncbi:MAG TPA: hypothetical protein VHO25_12615 [Polyangiaceae bacterium]|nr:hypothetical protein [Polyangiaceae bacterium]
MTATKTVRLATRSVDFPAYQPKGTGIGDYYDEKSHDARELSRLLSEARDAQWDGEDIRALESALSMARHTGD